MLTGGSAIDHELNLKTSASKSQATDAMIIGRIEENLWGNADPVVLDQAAEQLKQAWLRADVIERWKKSRKRLSEQRTDIWRTIKAKRNIED